MTAIASRLAPGFHADNLKAGQAGGSFSAEHGIGLEKRAALTRHASPERLDLMRRIKTAFDRTGS